MSGLELNASQLNALTPEELEKGRVLLKQQSRQAVTENPVIARESKAEPAPKKEVKTPFRSLPKNRSPSKSGGPFGAYIGQAIPSRISLDIAPFGYDLFRRAPKTFEPVQAIPVGPDYHLGPGDEIRITVWGKLNADFAKSIDRDGKIVLPQLGAVHLSGLTFSEAKTLIEKEFSRYYKSTEVKMNISMGQLRTIPVFVVGKVEQPGRYTLSSFSTLINALFVSGGPSPVGSMRDIQLKRDGKTLSRFDVYNLLLKGEKKGDLHLKSGDIIFVPTVGPRVGISGNVKVPAIYEMKGQNTLKALIEMAGGVTAAGDLQRVQVERISEDASKKVLDVNLDSLRDQDNIMLRDGDFVKIFSIDPRIKNAVTLKGNVVRPGVFEWREGMRVHDLFQDMDDFLPDTFLDFALIERLVPPDHHSEYLSVPLQKLLKQPETTENIHLRPDDKLVVFNRWDLLSKQQVRIHGAVNKPGAYEYRPKMKLSDLFKLAGGLQRFEHPESYLPEGLIVRRMPPDFHEEKIPYRVLPVAVADGDPSADFALQPLDEVYVFDQWALSQKKVARIAGAVNNPGTFSLAKNMRIRDLLSLAGGTKYYAYLVSAELTRIMPTAEGPKTERMDIDLEKAIAGDPASNILLKADDYLSVQNVPEWALYRTVRIEGEVRFPGAYTSKKGERLSSLIERAGGMTDSAYLKGAVFTRQSVRALQQQQLDDAIDRLEQQLLSRSSTTMEAALTPEAAAQQKVALAQRKALLAKMRSAKAKGRMALNLQRSDVFKESPSDVVLEEGDRLFIPERPQQVQVMGAVFNQTAFIFDDDTTVSKYLKKAGGMTEDADEDALYVLKVDGTAYSKRQNEGFWFWKKKLKSSTLDPGDTIVVPEKLDKIAWLRETKDITQILYQMAVTAGVLIVAF
ncbi:MAG: SLBB domain-containing protein [Nitrospiria bacterium]